MYIQIDWLSVNYLGNLTKTSYFTLKEEKIFSKYFKKYHIYSYNGEPVLHCLFEPCSSILDKNLIQLKIDNRYLYTTGFLDLLHIFVVENNLTFKGLSRLDLCTDFSLFHNKLKPQTFIKKFLSEHFIKKGKSKFSLRGEANKHLEHSYLKFGTNTSDICIYLYNKSKEMREVKNKPYISDLWNILKLNQETDIWRLEIKITGNTTKFIDVYNGDIHKLDVYSINSQNYLFNIYTALLYKHFTFYTNDKKIRTTDNQPLQLFDNLTSCYRQLKFCEKQDSTRGDKIFIKKLLNVYCELRDMKKDIADDYLHLANYEASRKILQKTFDKVSYELSIF